MFVINRLNLELIAFSKEKKTCDLVNDLLCGSVLQLFAYTLK